MAPRPRPWATMFAVALLAVASTASGARRASPVPARSTDGARVALAGPWTNLAPRPPLPAPRRDAGIAYDGRRDRVVIVGGSGGSSTWALDLSRPDVWTPLAFGAAPPATSGDDRAVYDAVNDRVVLLTGAMQVWALPMADPAAWQAIPVAGPPPTREGTAVAYDARRNRLLLFGGRRSSGVLGDVWALSLSGAPAWTQVVAIGPAPPARWGATAVYDSVEDRLVVAFGSLSTSNAFANDAWALSLAGPPAWAPLATAGTLPPARALAGGVFDPVLRRMLVFGGLASAGLDDLWELSLTEFSGWARVVPGNAGPFARWSGAVTCRSALPQMVVFGGFNGRPFNDTWTLDLLPLGGDPVIVAAEPGGGRVGDPVTIGGFRLEDANEVRFNGTLAPVLAVTRNSIATEVPAGATTGPLTVATPRGTATSPFDFFVGETPEVLAAPPGYGRAGDRVTIAGRHFTGATRVAFGGSGSAALRVVSDTEIEATIDSLAATGPISVTTPAATGTGDFVFRVAPPTPAPFIVGVRDVPRDQGGFVVVSWLGSGLDAPPHRVVTGYRIWRRERGPDGAAARDGPAPRAPGTARAGYWLAVADVPAGYLYGYSHVCPTSADSGAGGPARTAFVVQSLTADPFVSYDSAPDSGASVDNLAPPAPDPFEAEYRADGVALHWLPSRAPDLAAYRLHRGTGVDFVPGDGTLVLAAPDTGFFDPGGGAGHVYKLAATDVHGNHGRFAIVSAAAPSAGPATPLPEHLAAGRVALRWYLSLDDPLELAVQRRGPDEAWRALGPAAADGAGLVTFEDTGVEAGARYGYRLALRAAGGPEWFAGERWVALPPAPGERVLELPNPVAGGDVRVTFTAPPDRIVRVELFDLAGRVVATRHVPGGSGRGTVALARASDLAPGVYLVRVGLPVPAVARVVVIR